MGVIGMAFLALLQCGAAVETHSVSIAPAYTDWTNSISIPQFDPANGTLNSATLYLFIGNTSGTQVENADTGAWTIVSGSTVTGKIAGYVTAAAGVSFTNRLGAFDGAYDFAGPSGTNNPVASASNSASVVLSPAVATGTGIIPLTVQAKASGFFSGPGDYVFGVDTWANATVRIVYDYRAYCPDEPAPKPVCEKDRDSRDPHGSPGGGKDGDCKPGKKGGH